MFNPRLDLHVSQKRIVVMYFFSSLTFLLVGLYLCSVTGGIASIGFGGMEIEREHPYEDLGLRLVAFGMVLVVSTFYQSLIGEKKNLLKETNLAG
jgi:hypothetical protein